MSYLEYQGCHTTADRIRDGAQPNSPPPAAPAAWAAGTADPRGPSLRRRRKSARRRVQRLCGEGKEKENMTFHLLEQRFLPSSCCVGRISAAVRNYTFYNFPFYKLEVVMNNKTWCVHSAFGDEHSYHERSHLTT
jgi:hypothetical protein